MVPDPVAMKLTKITLYNGSLSFSKKILFLSILFYGTIYLLRVNFTSHFNIKSTELEKKEKVDSKISTFFDQAMDRIWNAWICIDLRIEIQCGSNPNLSETNADPKTSGRKQWPGLFSVVGSGINNSG
jgi:hypothetical protein